eukprot:TRINITY_DN1681_c0_g1_i18.p2 TRINITY_DN1681_c0_g1~~TRINITY_DN1681_c0_g1_i18.p2  ORF type:complete len:180 (+),score=47.89 TRINITY_DN1681_c0_g1_i18:958-1497(+)
MTLHPAVWVEAERISQETASQQSPASPAAQATPVAVPLPSRRKQLLEDALANACVLQQHAVEVARALRIVLAEISSGSDDEFANPSNMPQSPSQSQLQEGGASARYYMHGPVTAAWLSGVPGVAGSQQQLEEWAHMLTAAELRTIDDLRQASPRSWRSLALPCGTKDKLRAYLGLLPLD